MQASRSKISMRLICSHVWHETNATYAMRVACFSFPSDNVRSMNKTVIEVQVRAVLPTSGGCAVFLGNNDKVFIIYVDQTVGSAITMFMRGRLPRNAR